MTTVTFETFTKAQLNAILSELAGQPASAGDRAKANTRISTLARDASIKTADIYRVAADRFAAGRSLEGLAQAATPVPVADYKDAPKVAPCNVDPPATNEEIEEAVREDVTAETQQAKRNAKLAALVGKATKVAKGRKADAAAKVTAKADAKAYVATNRTRPGSKMDQLVVAMKREQGATLAELREIASWSSIASMPYRLAKQAKMVCVSFTRDGQTAWRFVASEAEAEAFRAANPKPVRESKPKVERTPRTKGQPAEGSKVGRFLAALREAGEDGLTTAAAREALGSKYVKQASDLLAKSHGVKVVCTRQGRDSWWTLEQAAA